MKRVSTTWMMVAIVLLAAGGHAQGGVTVITSSDPDALVGNILGSGITVVPGSASYVGAATASGFFSNGVASGIGIESGIILTSGDATLAQGANTLDDSTGDNGLPGDADLDAIAGTTHDASVLAFDFSSPGSNLFFNYVFASEEYNEFTNSPFNDVFAFFLDGQNIALIPGTTTPVSINNVNGGNPLGENASHPELFHNNDLDDGGPFFDLAYDGFTDAFTAQALGLTAGTHHIKLAVADTDDFILDSAVFIQGGTFSGIPTPPTPPDNVIPAPGAIVLGLLAPALSVGCTGAERCDPFPSRLILGLQIRPAAPFLW